MRKLIYIALLFISFSCEKDVLGPQFADGGNIDNTNRKVFILNEGTFTWGNASVTQYTPNTQTTTSSLFNTENNVPLGDVAQSMYRFNDKYYLVINNSDKIEVVDTTHFHSIATITGLNSPRYFLPINNTEAYVSSLYANEIYRVNLESNTITQSTAIPDWTEQMVYHNGKIFATGVNNGKLYVLNTNNHQLTDSLTLTKGASSMVLDINQKLWVMCSGGIQQQNPALYKINPFTLTIEQTFTFSDNMHSPGNLCISPDLQTLYFLNEDVYQMEITNAQLPTNFIIDNGSKTFYALDIDPYNGDIYVADAIDYVQQGKIYRYNQNIELINDFDAGIIPGFFWFE